MKRGEWEGRSEAEEEASILLCPAPAVEAEYTPVWGVTWRLHGGRGFGRSAAALWLGFAGPRLSRFLVVEHSQRRLC